MPTIKVAASLAICVEEAIQVHGMCALESSFCLIEPYFSDAFENSGTFISCIFGGMTCQRFCDCLEPDKRSQ